MKTKFAIAALLTLLLFVADIAFGAADISPTQALRAVVGGDCPETVRRIVVDIRLVKALAALLVGAALSVSGLEMQTLFRNPLAGPYVLGISSGATLGVALTMLGASAFALPLASGLLLSSLGTAGAAFLGAFLVLLIIEAAGRRVKDIMVVLVLGILFSSGVGAVVQILQYLSREEALKSFVIWTMGSLSDISSTGLAIMAVSVVAGLILAVAQQKSLNLLLLGEQYARTMGLNARLTRRLVFLSTALLAGSATAFCGPIGFIGLAIPHVARAVFQRADHRTLIPASALIGALTMVGCDLVAKTLVLPLNAITSIVGIPLVIWIVLRHKALTV